MQPLRQLLVATAIGVTLTAPAHAQDIDPWRVPEIRAQAEAGDAGAQGALGVLYYEGLGGIQRDYAEAARWLGKAAGQGNALAQVSLGRMHTGGLGIPQDYAEGARWLRKAAEQGNAHGQASLGLLHYEGLGVPHDYTEAARWSRHAAEQGEANAQIMLGIMYADGHGVAQDHVSAHMWFNLAASQSTGELSEEAVKERDAVAARMTREDLDEAQRRAREWRLRHVQ